MPRFAFDKEVTALVERYGSPYGIYILSRALALAATGDMKAVVQIDGKPYYEVSDARFIQKFNESPPDTTPEEGA